MTAISVPMVGNGCNIPRMIDPDKPVWDWMLRNLIAQDAQKKTCELARAIHYRRIAFGLGCQEKGCPDLSYLDLSNTVLTELSQKTAEISDANFSGSVIKRGNFCGARIWKCSFVGARFFACDFSGLETDFVGTDLQDAVFDQECRFGEGQNMSDLQELQRKLSRLGALHTETVRMKELPIGPKAWESHR